MTGIRRLTVLCGMAVLLAIPAFAPAALADEARFQEKSVTEGNRGRRYHGGGRRGGGRHHGGWGWAGFGASVGLGVLSAITNDPPETYVYVQPAPSYQVVYPSTPVYSTSPYYYYPQSGQTVYVHPGYGRVYTTPVRPGVPYRCP